MVDKVKLDRIKDEHIDLANLFPSLSHRYVAGEGNQAQAFIIGEAPGAQEDIAGRPFVGHAGQVLRDLMRIADLYAQPTVETTDALYANSWLTNVLKFRPPNNRAPTEAEIKAFRPLLIKEWHAVGTPDLIIPVGGIALRAVTGRPLSILRAAGKCHKYLSAYTGKPLYVWPMVHPSFGLRMPAVQPLLEQDWEALAKWRQKPR